MMFAGPLDRSVTTYTAPKGQRIASADMGANLLGLVARGIGCCHLPSSQATFGERMAATRPRTGVLPELSLFENDFREMR